MEDEFARRLGIDAVKQHIHDKLKAHTLRGVTLRTVDNTLNRGDDRALGAFILWLQDQLKDWDKLGCQRTIQAFCDRLRLHNIEAQHIFDSFHLWKLVQIDIDPSLRSQLSAIEEELRIRLCRKHNGIPAPPLHPPHDHHTVFDLDQPRIDQTQHAVHHMDKFNVDSCFSRESTATMKKSNVIEVASSDDASDVAPLRQKTSGYQQLKDNTRPKLRISSSDKVPLKTNDQSDNNDEYLVIDMRGGKVEGNLPTKPTKGRYVCNRCSEPGHALQDCPTNMDPNYDRAPGAGYVCSWCGAQEEHYATLCPRSKKIDSLYNLRIQAGMITRSNFPRCDSYRPPYGNPNLGHTEQAEQAPEAMENGIIHADRLAMMDFDHRHDAYTDQPLRTTGKRSYSRQQSPWDGQRSSRRDNDQYSSHKRSRPDSQGQEQDRRHARGRDLDEERGWDNRRDLNHRIRFVSPTASRKSSVIRDNLELLPTHTQLEVDKFWKWDGYNDGRLSYWDDGYESPLVFQSPTEHKLESTSEQTPDGQTPTFSPSVLQLRTQSSAIGFWSDGNVEREIRERFPVADLGWVADMAGFDVDAFFSQMDDFMTAKGTVRSGEEIPHGMETAADIFDEEANGPCPHSGIMDIHESQRDWSEEGECTPALDDALLHVKESQVMIDDDYEALGSGHVQEKVHEDSWEGFSIRG